MRTFPDDYNLYLVSSQEYCFGRDTLSVAEAAIPAGVDILQMREKTLPRGQLINLGKKLVELCQKNNTVFIVNDDPHLAAELGAWGVHLGQNDLEQFPIYKVREVLGPDKIIGLSTHSLEQVKAAGQLDINYIAFGPIFKTETKGPPVGTADIEKVQAISPFPVVYIGGINSVNIEELLSKGAKNIALIREICQAVDVGATVKNLKVLINRYKN
jgi:thiamine-phosphate pyrophosphorylase